MVKWNYANGTEQYLFIRSLLLLIEYYNTIQPHFANEIHSRIDLNLIPLKVYYIFIPFHCGCSLLNGNREWQVESFTLAIANGHVAYILDHTGLVFNASWGLDFAAKGTAGRFFSGTFHFRHRHHHTNNGKEEDWFEPVSQNGSVILVDTRGK